MFNPDRLTLARLRAGFSKAQLAELMGLSTRTITNYESGNQNPSKEIVIKLAETLKFLPDFFYLPHAPSINMEDRDKISFRARSKITRGQIDTARASLLMGAEIHQWMQQKLNLPTISLPDLGQYADDPEIAAEILRKEWGLGQQPIKHLLDIVEKHGVMVFSLAMDTVVVDAFSAWHDGVPMIFLNRKKTAERCRFDLAHELGHLLLHAGTKPQGKELEQQADQFASALLMPRAAVMAERIGAGALQALLPIKRRWGVSAAALNYRLHKLGRISDWLYRSNCIQLSERGRDKEPGENIQMECSQLWSKSFAALAAAGISQRDMAKELTWGLPRLHELTFGLEVINNPMPVGKTESGQSKPLLRIVK